MPFNLLGGAILGRADVSTACARPHTSRSHYPPPTHTHTHPPPTHPHHPHLAAGVPFNQIGKTIHSVADRHRFGVVRMFVGHGVGTVFHAYPHINHFR